MHYAMMPTPLGALLLLGDERGLCRVEFPGSAPPTGAREDAGPFREVMKQLGAYFSGELRDFDFPMVPQGTPFQLRAWQELRQIPYGETISYREQARRMGDANASRAAGLANGRNPLPIVVPCHRVIGSSGKLTGYGGGLPIKQFLLDLEAR